MDRFTWKEIHNQHVLYVDLTDLEKKDLVDTIKVSKEVIKNSHYDDIMVFTNINNMTFDRHTTRAFEEVAKINKDHVKFSAIYGAGPWIKVAIEAVGKLVNREFYVFKTEEDMNNWLSEHTNFL